MRYSGILEDLQKPRYPTSKQQYVRILRFTYHFAQLAGKRNPEQEKEAQEWIESILGKKFPPGEAFEDVLKDGQVLCHLMNKLSPGSVPKINTTGGQFKMMENINL